MAPNASRNNGHGKSIRALRVGPSMNILFVEIRHFTARTNALILLFAKHPDMLARLEAI